MMSEPMRIQRALARAGVASRRKAEELIAAGRVRVIDTLPFGECVYVVLLRAARRE